MSCSREIRRLSPASFYSPQFLQEVRVASLERDIKLLEDELNRFREQTAAVERDRRSEVTRQGDLLKSQERQMKERVRQKNVF